MQAVSGLRRVETGLAWFTLVALVFFAPGETWVTLAMTDGDIASLVHPLYLIDVIGMVLMLWGALHSLRARPLPAPGLLCAGLAWMASNGWRSTWFRVASRAEGNPLFYGSAEMWVTLGLTALALAAMGLALYLTWRAGSLPAAAPARDTPRAASL